MTKITIPEATPETPTVEQAAKALIDAVEDSYKARITVTRHVRPTAFLAALRALAGDA